VIPSIGQAIGNNAALFPAPIQEKFAKLFDDAPQVPYSEIRAVFLSQFNKEPAGPNGIFEEFEEQAVASASIAQVHKAKLKSPDGNGPVVAVKIQKPALAKQVEWDLGAYRLVMWIYENYLFDMPVYFLVGTYIGYVEPVSPQLAYLYRLHLGSPEARA
jgi:aarF domain-containing kinase